MTNWDVGISTGCFRERALPGVLEPLRLAGFDLLEISTHRQHFDYRDQAVRKEAARVLRALEMRVFSIHAPFGPDIDISSRVEERRRKGVAEILLAAEAGAQLGARNLVLHPGPEDEFAGAVYQRAERMTLAAESIREISRRCRELGIGLLLENQPPHLVFGGVRPLVWFLEAVSEEDVSLCLNLGHANLDRDYTTAAAALPARASAVHAHDNHGDRNDQLPPGEGSIDWEETLADMRRAGYAGPLLLELAGRDRNAVNEAQGALETAQRAQKFLRAAIAQVKE